MKNYIYLPENKIDGFKNELPILYSSADGEIKPINRFFEEVLKAHSLVPDSRLHSKDVYINDFDYEEELRTYFDYHYLRGLTKRVRATGDVEYQGSNCSLLRELAIFEIEIKVFLAKIKTVGYTFGEGLGALVELLESEFISSMFTSRVDDSDAIKDLSKNCDELLSLAQGSFINKVCCKNIKCVRICE